MVKAIAKRNENNLLKVAYYNLRPIDEHSIVDLHLINCHELIPILPMLSAETLLLILKHKVQRETLAGTGQLDAFLKFIRKAAPIFPDIILEVLELYPINEIILACFAKSPDKDGVIEKYADVVPIEHLVAARPEIVDRIIQEQPEKIKTGMDVTAIILHRPDLMTLMLDKYHSLLNGFNITQIITKYPKNAANLLVRFEKKITVDSLPDLVKARPDLAITLIKKFYPLLQNSLTGNQDIDLILTATGNNIDVAEFLINVAKTTSIPLNAGTLLRHHPELYDCILQENPQLIKYPECVVELICLKPENAEVILHHFGNLLTSGFDRIIAHRPELAELILNQYHEKLWEPNEIIYMMARRPDLILAILKTYGETIFTNERLLGFSWIKASLTEVQLATFNESLAELYRNKQLPEAALKYFGQQLPLDFAKIQQLYDLTQHTYWYISIFPGEARQILTHYGQYIQTVRFRLALINILEYVDEGNLYQVLSLCSDLYLKLPEDSVDIDLIRIELFSDSGYKKISNLLEYMMHQYGLFGAEKNLALAKRYLPVNRSFQANISTLLAHGIFKDIALVSTNDDADTKPLDHNTNFSL